MRKQNRFHFSLDRNRDFLANGTITVGKTRTDITVNVDSDPVAIEQCVVVLLMAIHNITNSDDDRADISAILARYGATDPSPVKQRVVLPEEALAEAEDDWLFVP